MSRRYGSSENREEPLSSIRILFRAPDTLTLWGVPYEMRPGQQPGDLWRAYRDWQPPDPRYLGGARRVDLGWIYLGEPGWYGSMSPGRVAEVKAFLARHKADVPGGPYEWVRLGHTRDEDCTLGPDGCCVGCGVSHTGVCSECGGKGFHKARCSESESRSHGDLPRRASRHAYAVGKLTGRRPVAIVPAFSAGDAVRRVSRSKGISEILLRARRLK